MELAGRRQEMGEIRRLLDQTEAGSGGLLVVTGPAGSGKTALASAAVEEAHRRGFEVLRASPTNGQRGRWVWAQLLRELGDADRLAVRLLEDAAPLELDDAARQLASGTRRLIVVDDIDRGEPEAVEVLAMVAGRLLAASTAVVTTARLPLGLEREIRLGALTESELAPLLGSLPGSVRHAVWLASRGLPGVARSMAADVAGLGAGADAIVYLALHAPSGAEFLDVDVELVRLLETAVSRTLDDATRARVLARLAHELLGDASATVRRRALMNEAIDLAHRSGDKPTLAEVLDARLHALWDPAGADDRLATATEIVDLARAAPDGRQECHGLFWRFVALMELGRVADAESALAEYERVARAAGVAEGAVLVRSRQAMLAILRGRFDDAGPLIEEVGEMGRRVGLPDTDRLVATLRGQIAMWRDTSPSRANVEMMFAFARRLPGHFMEATAARILAYVGRPSEASAELERLLPTALAGSGPRWLGAITDLADVAARTRNSAAAARLYPVLAPYRGRLVVWGGANTVTGPVSHYLGLLATELGMLDDAVTHFDEAVALSETIGALPWVAESLARLADALERRSAAGDPQRASERRRRAQSIAARLGAPRLLEGIGAPGDEWTLARDGEDWLLQAGDERARLGDSRGLHYLRALLAAPGREISALDLAAGGAGLVVSSAGPVLDASARDAYRRRLAELNAELDVADRIGDRERAEAAEAEREAVLDELRRASGLGGRQRETSAEAERARVNVTRTLRASIDRIGVKAPRAAAHLHASIRTGLGCRYEPAAGGPSRWHV
jgi:tetratricopeptide (TPR) repeat protein